MFLGALVNEKSNLSAKKVYLDIVKQRRWLLCMAGSWEVSSRHAESVF